jgi:hypothetical protein
MSARKIYSIYQWHDGVSSMKRRRRSQRTDNFSGQWQTPGHSAHIGQEVEVHYRWHALYGRRLRRQYVERRAGGDVVHVEVTPGVVIVVAAWMLDRAACAGMSLGAPRVKLAALAELHQLLVERGFRRSSRDDPTIVQEEQHEELARNGSAIRGPAPAQHCIRFGKASRDDLVRAPDRGCPAGQSAVGGRQHCGRGA